MRQAQREFKAARRGGPVVDSTPGMTGSHQLASERPKSYQAGFAAAQLLLDADPNNVQPILDVAYSRYKLAMAGFDRHANLTAARDAMAVLKGAGRLPPAFESWVAMVDVAFAAKPQP